MARGFGTVDGSGTTDLVQTSLTGNSVATRSYFIWTYNNGVGGGTVGRIIDQRHGTAGGNFFFYSQGINKFEFQQEFSTTGGIWRWDPPALSSWHSLGISYDNSATTNDPVVYHDGSTVTVTEISTPNGTAITGNTKPLCIGNRPDGLRNWNGLLAEAAVWDAILGAAEFAALGKGYSPLIIRPASLVEYVPMVRANVSRKLAAPTITGTAVQPHPRIIMPHRRQFYRKATPTFIPAWAQNSNLPVIGAGTH